MAESHRQQRVAERIRKILSAELAKSNFSDKVLDKQPITITHVDPSPDLRHAKVFFTALGGVALVPVKELRGVSQKIRPVTAARSPRGAGAWRGSRGRSV